MTKLVVVSFCKFANALEIDVVNKGHKIAFFERERILPAGTFAPSNARE
jgi:hypothetical protein